MSNSQIQNFNFGENQIRTIHDEKGEPWFVAKDVCDVLEHTNSRMALSSLEDDEKGVSNIHTLGGEQSMSTVNESGLYSLIFKSRKPEARLFRKWVTSEVLPVIRKTGLFAVMPRVESDLVAQIGEDTWATTNKIAEVFGRRHDDVIVSFERGYREIQEIEMRVSLKNKETLGAKMEATTYMDSQGKVQPCYRVNRPLFNYVALNFTGENASVYRYSFIRQFEAIERYTKVQLAKQLIYEREKDQVVYVFKNEHTGLVKVGVAKDPVARMRTLANQSGCDLQMVYCTPKCKNAYEIEQSIHKALSDSRGIGEWFEVLEDEVVDLLRASTPHYGSGFSPE